MELTSVAVLVLVLLMLLLYSRSMYVGILGLINSSFGRISYVAEVTRNETDRSPSVTVNYLVSSLSSLLIRGEYLIIPILLVAFGVAMFANIVQVGVVFSSYPIIPRMERINPINGLRRIFSMRSLFELAKALFKIAIISYVGYVTIKARVPELPYLSDMGIAPTIGYIANASFHIFLRTCIALVILAVIDYLYQRWDYERNLMMTLREFREELRATEGDPFMRARIRSMQREVSRRRMLQRVPEADVVLTNPVYLAVALKYEPQEHSAPFVVAKGARLIADKIKQIAVENGVPIVEDPPLTQSIYKAVDIDEEIPEEFYEAVAEILAYIYAMTNSPKLAMA
jgi:flagellar biosynthetic protein FlhB